MNSFRRFRRDTPKVLATIIAIVAIAGTFLSQIVIQGQAKERVADSWRSSYDLLVLPSASRQKELVDQEGRTLLDSNYANVTGTSIPNDLVQAVEDIKQVEVAAPIGFIARYSAASEVPTLTIPFSLFDSDPKAALRITQTVTVNDGLDERVSTSEVDHIVLDSTEYKGGLIWPFGDNFLVVGDRTVPYRSAGEGTLSIALNQLPDVSTTLFAVDPVQEAKLLGQDKSGFLKSMLDFESAVSALGKSDPVTVRDLAELAPSDSVRRDLEKLGIDYSADPSLSFGVHGTESRVIPIVRNSSAYPPSILSVVVDEVVKKSEGDAEDILSRMPSSDYRNVGETSLNLSDSLLPFAGSQIGLPWPGTEEVGDNSFAGKYKASTIEPLKWDLRPNEGPDKRLTSVEVQAQGFIYATSRQQEMLRLGQIESATGRGLGESQTYRSSLPIEQGDEGMLPWGYSGMPPTEAAAAPIVVGTFDPEKIKGTDSLPLGAYDAAKVRKLDSKGNPQQSLEPTLHGLGLATQASSALTTLEGARTLGVSNPVNAIRVRVANLTGDIDADTAKINEIAEEIASLGLSAYPVAGSSPQTVQAYVPNYAFGTADASSSQTVASLGWVALEYTTLEAGITARDAVSKSGAQVATWGQLLVLISLVALYAIQYPRRQADNRILFGQSMSFWQRFRWHLSEDLYLLLAVSILVVTLGANAHSQNHDFSLLESYLPLIVVALTVLGNALVSARNARTIGKNRIRKKGATPRIVRIGLERTPILLVKSSAVALIALTIALTVDLLVRSHYLLGTTEIGQAVAMSITAPSAITALAAAAGAVLILSIATQSDLERQTADWIVATRSASVRWRAIRWNQVVENSVMVVLSVVMMMVLSNKLFRSSALDAGLIPVDLPGVHDLNVLLTVIMAFFVFAGFISLLFLSLRRARNR